ncbi:MAG: hypothetical protein ACRCX2_12235 [Paraclostridium sp.]
MDNKDYLNFINNKFQGKDTFLGRSLLTFAATMSSSRGILSTSQIEQAEVLLNPEKPRIFTGYEKEFGSYSNGYLKASANYEVIAKISKYPHLPDHMYILVVKDVETGLYDVIYKKHYEELTENYSYKYKTETLDSFNIGDSIPKDEVLYKSTSFDDRMNWAYGINLFTAYICDVRTTEDAFVISKSAADKFGSVKQDKVEILVNENDILLNLYGTRHNYKTFPDIGEPVKKRKITAKRRIVNEEVLFALSSDRLTHVLDDDDVFVAHSDAVLMDVNIYCNREIHEMEIDFSEMTEENPNYQLYKYYIYQLNYYRSIVETLGNIALINGRENCSHDLKFALKDAQEMISGDKFVRNDSVYNNMIVEFKLLSKHHLGVGGKMVGRYGDKGVISKVVPDDEMPRVTMPDGSKKSIEMIANPFGVPNRTNLGQLFEIELDMMGAQVIHQMHAFDDITKFKIFMDFIITVNPAQAKLMIGTLGEWSMKERISFLKNVIEEVKYIPTRQSPFWDIVGLDLLETLTDLLLDKYGIKIEKYEVEMYKFGRWIKARRTIVAGHKYYMKLKHCPESKFSARSTGFINPRGLPNKSRINKQNRALYSNTPVRFGNQEIMLFMIGRDSEKIVHKMLMLHSSSIKGRRSVGELLDMNVLDPYIDLPEDATDRNTEILKMYLRTMGIELKSNNDVVNPFYMGGKKELRSTVYKDDYNKDLYSIPATASYDDGVACRGVNNGVVVVKKRYEEDPSNKGHYSLKKTKNWSDVSLEDYMSN